MVSLEHTSDAEARGDATVRRAPRPGAQSTEPRTPDDSLKLSA